MADENNAGDVLYERILSQHAGMDNFNASWIVEANRAQELVNLDIQTPGQRVRRLGCASIGGVSAATNVRAPSGLFALNDTTQNQEVLYGIWDGSLFLTPGNGAFTRIGNDSTVSFTRTMHNATIGRQAGKQCAFVSTFGQADSGTSLASKLLMIDEDRNFTQTASMAPRFAVWWGGRLWCAANVLSQDEDTLWWSELLDGLSYSAINTLRAEPGRGGHITGLMPVRSTSNTLIIFKERLIAVLEAYWG